MKIMDEVEVIAEKDKYAKHGVHKGMQGVIWDERKINGSWLVLIPQYGTKKDIAEIGIKEEDLKLVPNGINVKINEKIKKQFENIESH